MTLLAYQKYNNPLSHKDVLEKIKIFGESCGWVCDYQTGCAWGRQAGGEYGWVGNGSEDFLELHSTGYGTQDMRLRIKMTGTGTNPKTEFMHVGLSPGIPYDPAVSKHPVDQNTINSSNRNHTSVPPGTVPALWIFGNSKYLLIIYQIAQDLILPFHFGTIDLFEENTDFYTANSPYHNAHPYPKWYQMFQHPARWDSPWARWDWGNAQAFWDNKVWGTSHVCSNVYVDPGTDLASRNGHFDRMRYAVAANRWTGKRPLIKPTVYGKRESDGMWEPVGAGPYYFLEFAGLNIGEHLVYGDQEYICFPVIFSTDRFGVAFRVK